MARSHRRSPLDVLADIVMGVLIVLLVAFVVGRYVFGARAFAVLTGSMAPELNVGDLVIDVPAEFEDIAEGDVITYVINDNLDVATHRVVGIDALERTLLTKGDANDTTDGTPVDYRNVVGVVRLSVPRLGYVLSFLSTMTGKIVAITVILAVTVIFAIAHLLVGGEDDDGEDATGQSGGSGAKPAPGGMMAPSASPRRDISLDDAYDGYLEDAGDYCDDDEDDEYFDEEDDDFLFDDEDWFDDEFDEFDDGPSLTGGNTAS